ncbi:MAG: murein transglycosylase A [Alphaproteobacteria bacterium]|nr:murein transglycosylase A [Alphaproteobacteria bacterium]
MRTLIFSLMVLVLASCTTAEAPPATDEKTPMVLQPVSFADLPDWKNDDHASALATFAKSCARINKIDAARAFSKNIAAGTIGDWQKICAQLPGVTDARAFFETHFVPHAARAEGGSDVGLFTGYYEATLRGSRTKQGPYQYPLHSRPADLVMVELGEFREDLKGQRIAGRVADGKLKPYEDRAKIVAGQWPHNDQVLVWVDDPVDAFFLQIQGSGVVQLDDGSLMRVGYDGQNGHVYYAIGRELVKREILSKDEVSMQSIRAWLEQNPDQAMDFMNLNKSYVFMRALDGDGPLGAENVVLTPGRSLAVDSGKMAYGVPVWVDLGAPTDGEAPIKRLMVAQDTGGAIRGAVRGDVFFGYGERAEHLAGLMKAKGRYWILLPQQITN